MAERFLDLTDGKKTTLAPGEVLKNTYRAVLNGAGLPACAVWASNKVAGWSRFWANLSNPLLHPTVAFSLLKFCGQAKFQHIAQALPPDVCREAATHFDTAVSAVLAARLQTSVADCGPARDVLGIACYADHLAAFYDHTTALARGDHTTSVAQVRARLFTRGGSAATSSTPFVGRLVSSSTGPWSSAAYVPNVRLAASDFVMGVRIRCGLPAAALLPPSCTCGFTYSGVNNLVVNSHLLSCPHNVGNTWTTRHHGVTYPTGSHRFPCTVGCGAQLFGERQAA
jgi:hypothetical protein